MGQTFGHTLLMSAVFALFMGFHNDVAFADELLFGKATLNSAIYCIPDDGEMHEVEGVFPDTRTTYLLITGGGAVSVLNKCIEIPEQIFEKALKAIRADKAKGKIFQDQRRWWCEFRRTNTETVTAPSGN